MILFRYVITIEYGSRACEILILEYVFQQTHRHSIPVVGTELEFRSKVFALIVLLTMLLHRSFKNMQTLILILDFISNSNCFCFVSRKEHIIIINTMVISQQ